MFDSDTVVFVIEAGGKDEQVEELTEYAKTCRGTARAFVAVNMRKALCIRALSRFTCQRQALQRLLWIEENQTQHIADETSQDYIYSIEVRHDLCEVANRE